MNTVNLVGRTTSNIELKNVGNDNSVCNFCLAVDAGKDRTYFIDCVAWDSKAKQISETIKKGDKMGVSGVLTTRSWQDSSGNNRKATEVLVMAFDYCSPKNTEKKEEVQPEAQPPVEAQEAGENLPFEI